METSKPQIEKAESTKKEKEIRITQHGKMKAFVANALSFLESEEEEQSVVFHSLPHVPKDWPVTSGTPTWPPITQKSASLVTSVVPRLISVVEILKREYMKVLEANKSPRMLGLHQYNEIGTLEELGITITSDEVVADEDKRSTDIIHALSGKNHARQTQTPYMRVTLSKTERPDLLANGATYQPPAIRKQSKAAKSRAKKRAAKAAEVKDVTMEDSAI